MYLHYKCISGATELTQYWTNSQTHMLMLMQTHKRSLTFSGISGRGPSCPVFQWGNTIKSLWVRPFTNRYPYGYVLRCCWDVKHQKTNLQCSRSWVRSLMEPSQWLTYIVTHYVAWRSTFLGEGLFDQHKDTVTESFIISCKRPGLRMKQHYQVTKRVHCQKYFWQACQKYFGFV